MNLLPKTGQALNESAAREGLSRTDVVNRALMVYCYLGREVANGRELYLSTDKDLRNGHATKLHILG